MKIMQSSNFTQNQNSLNKTHIHFGESDIRVDESLYEKKLNAITDNAHFKKGYWKNEYKNSYISWKKLCKEIRQINEQEQICKNCLDGIEPPKKGLITVLKRLFKH